MMPTSMSLRATLSCKSIVQHDPVRHGKEYAMTRYVEPTEQLVTAMYVRDISRQGYLDATRSGDMCSTKSS